MNIFHNLTEGFLMGAGLIIAIGAQNAFVLRQGIARDHHLMLAFICSMSDALLITAGVLGMGALFKGNFLLTAVFTAAGTLYLLYFAFMSFRSAFKNNSLNAAPLRKKLSRRQALITVLALTYLNPHVYIDTVVMLGSFGASRPQNMRIYFTIGAVSASFIWFFGLSYGGKILAPLFKKAAAWRILDTAVGILMLYISLRLALFACELLNQ